MYRMLNTLCLRFALVLGCLTVCVAFLATSVAAQESGTGQQPQLAKPDSERSIQNASDQPAPETATPSVSNRHFKVAWDTTLKYSNAFRLSRANPLLVDSARNPSNINQDDGDRNFHGGMISDRADILSEIEVTYGGWGARASMTAWQDEAYNQRNANNSPFTNNNLTTNYDHFTAGTQDISFRHANLMDAFAFGKIRIGSGELTIRGGQYAQFWGESLFFGNNGIAGGMAPIDVVKAESVPFTQFRELIRPVPQIGVQYQINHRVAIGAYYQLGWGADVLPSAGSYFSESDILGQGAESLFAGPLTNPVTGAPVIDPVTHQLAWTVFGRSPDLEARNWGQGGVQLKLRPGRGLDLGFYAIQYNEKTPQLYLAPTILGAPTPLPPMDGGVVPNLQIGNYNWVYPERIQAYGISATKTTGIVNWAGEISGRTHMDLTSDGQAISPGHGGNLVFNQFGAPTSFVVTADNDNHPLYAVGDSIHANFSGLASFGPSFISREASLVGEVAWNRLLSISQNPGALDPNTTRDAVGMQVQYTPTYRQVRPGLDLSPSVGISYYPLGKSAVITTFGPDSGGTITFGVTAAYMDHWQIGMNYNRFYGPAAGFLDPQQHYTMQQPLADRNFISFSIYRTLGLRAGGGKVQ